MTNSSEPLKVLHFNVMKHLSRGIKNQLISEQESIPSLPSHINWTTKVFSQDEPNLDFMVKVETKKNTIIPKNISNYINLKQTAYKWLVQEHDKYDVVLIRYFPGDPFLFNAIKNIKNAFTIHHTIEGEEVKTQEGIIGLLHASLESFIAPYVLRRSQGVIGVTNQIQKYEQKRSGLNIPGFTLPNGINTKTALLIEDERNTEIRLAFVAAAFAPWHGLDIVLNEFKKNNIMIHLDVIGSVPNALKYEDPRIKYHGVLDKNHLTQVLQRTDIGLTSFGLFRNKMTEGSTLKLREYLAFGIPVYGDSPDSALPSEFPYYLVDTFSLEKVKSAAIHLKKVRRDKIRKESLQYIEKSELMSNLCDWLVTYRQ